MNLTINGSQHSHEGAGSLAELLEELGANEDQVAMMVNDRIVPKDKRGSVQLKDGDRVEILTFMGGG